MESGSENAWRAREGSIDDNVRDDTNRDVEPRSRRMLNALGAMAATGLEAGPIPIVWRRHIEIVLHVDHDYLAGLADPGCCRLNNGPAINLADAHRPARNARIRTMVHGTNGTAVDLGRS